MSPLPLARARSELAIARLLIDHGHCAQALSRTYFAAFYAATLALHAVGESRSKHSGVISAFSQRVVLTGGFPSDQASILRLLYTLRNSADYQDIDIAMEQAEANLRAAARFVDAVEAWMGSL